MYAKTFAAAESICGESRPSQSATQAVNIGMRHDTIAAEAMDGSS